MLMLILKTLTRILVVLIHLNTSHVNVNHPWLLKFTLGTLDLNTSHVNVNLTV